MTMTAVFTQSYTDLGSAIQQLDTLVSGYRSSSLVIAAWGLAAGAFTPFYTVHFSQYHHLGLERIETVNSIAQISRADICISGGWHFVSRFGYPAVLGVTAAVALASAFIPIDAGPEGSRTERTCFRKCAPLVEDLLTFT